MSQQSMLSSQETPTRNAAPRFTEDEKTVLIALLGEFKHIIEYKKTDVASLKKCWNKPQTKIKEEAAREKRERHKTEDLWQGANPVELLQLPTGTDADEDSRKGIKKEQLRRLQCDVPHL
ncbi:hypothetical protein MRX96_020847 [Rhipicephalus microplus]